MIPQRLRNLHSALLCVFLCQASAIAQTPDYATLKQPATAIKGALVIVGGGNLPDAVRDQFLKLAGGSKARLVVIPTASDSADGADADKGLETWKKLGVESVALLHTRSREKANDAAFVKPLIGATGVWLGGGDQTKLIAAYRGTLVEAELKKLLERGGVIGGTSAGAAVMSRLMIASGKTEAAAAQGFGFLPGVVIDQHFTERKRLDRLKGLLAKHAGWAGVGIDEQTALIVRGRTIDVVGLGSATVCLAACENRPEKVEEFKAGAKIDLVALSRSALVRAGAAFPPAKPAAPIVAKGTLFIGGGGGLSDAVYERFIEAAGGPKKLIVVIPVANPDPLPVEPYDVKRFKKLGATNVRVLSPRTPAQADAPESLALLKEAAGIWFGGGRQWRLVDAFLDTAAHKEMHALLQRGGAIGGSSAGASIQSEYMPRGHPLGNTVMMAEGYERGLGFLPGAAVDQHFFKRKRTADMTLLIKTYPQLLGIGIDEGTVLIVRGQEMEVMGASNVAVYDARRKSADGELDYELLRPGERYDMKERRRVAAK